MQNKPKKKLTIGLGIPTYKRPKKLYKLLNSISRQTRYPDEIIIACRYNDSETISIADKWSKLLYRNCKVKVIKVYEKGHIPPIIEALKYCECEIFCQTDDDAIPRKNWLQKIEKDFEDQKVGGITGKVINHIKDKYNKKAKKVKISESGVLSWYGKTVPIKSNKKKDQLVDAICFKGGNMAFRSSILRRAIDLRLNGGAAAHYEIDIALTVKKKGFKTYYDSQAIVDHYPAPRMTPYVRDKNSKGHFWFAHNYTYICMKHLKWYGKIIFFIYYFIGGQWESPGIVTYLLSNLFRNRVSFLKQLLPSYLGRFAGIKSYIKNRALIKKREAL
jgi:GT2 family glycosyltransferase